MRRKFSAAQTSLNSQRAFSMPRKLNCLNPSTCLTQPLGGSTLVWAGGEDVARAFANIAKDAEHLQALRVLLRELGKYFGVDSSTTRDVINKCLQWSGMSTDAFSTDSGHATCDALEAM